MFRLNNNVCPVFWVHIIIVSVILFISLMEKESRLFWCGFIIIIVFGIYNDFSRTIIGKLSDSGSESVYYRFLWIVPWLFVIAADLVLIVNKYKKFERFAEVAIIVLLVLATIFCVKTGRSTFSGFKLRILDNQLYCSDELYEINQIIDSSSEDERILYLATGDEAVDRTLITISNKLQEAIDRSVYWQYDKYKSAPSDSARFYQCIFEGKKGYTKTINNYLDKNQIDIIIFPTASEMRDYMPELNFDFIGSAANYDIYKNKRKLERIYNNKNQLLEMTYLDAEGKPSLRNGKYA